MIAASHIRFLREKLNDILAKNCGKTLEEIDAATDRDYWMSAEEAVGFGIADRILY